MKTKSTLIELLLKQSEMYLRDLPETIRIPALDGNRSDEVVRPLEDATIDDLASRFRAWRPQPASTSVACKVCAISTSWPASAALWASPRWLLRLPIWALKGVGNEPAHHHR